MSNGPFSKGLPEPKKPNRGPREDGISLTRFTKTSLASLPKEVPINEFSDAIEAYKAGDLFLLIENNKIVYILGIGKVSKSKAFHELYIYTALGLLIGKLGSQQYIINPQTGETATEGYWRFEETFECTPSTKIYGVRGETREEIVNYLHFSMISALRYAGKVAITRRETFRRSLQAAGGLEVLDDGSAGQLTVTGEEAGNLSNPE